MTKPPALEERVTMLEYTVFEQLPPTLAAMRQATTQLHSLTQANGEAIAGVRVDMAALRATIDLQGDSLRKEMAVLGASVRTDITNLSENMIQRFERTVTEFRIVHGEISDLKSDVSDLKTDMSAVKSRLDGVESKLDTLITEFRDSRTTERGAAKNPKPETQRNLRAIQPEA
jgi:hypothetical protein